MRVAVDFQSTQGKPTGIGVFAKSLCGEIERLKLPVSFVYLKKSTSRDLNAAKRIVWENIEIPLKVRGKKVDVLYSPGFSPPVFSACPRVVTVHDIIGKVYPSKQGRGAKFYWSRWQPWALRHAEKIVVSSESTRRDLRQYLGISDKKIEVVYLGARPQFSAVVDPQGVSAVLVRHALIAPYLIAVGSLEPRKNILGALRAFEQARKSMPGLKLVIVGKPAGAEADITRFIQEKNIADQVKLIGYVSDSDLLALYHGAVAYLMLSYYEGFGYPVLEGMACGLSGVVSERSSLPEIAGDAALLVDPDNEGQVVSALKSILTNSKLRESLSAKALERVPLFSLENTARKMTDIFYRAAGRSGASR